MTLKKENVMVSKNENNCKFVIFLPNHDVCDAFWETEVHLIEKQKLKIDFIKKKFFSLWGTSVTQKVSQTSWLGKKWQIYSYFSFLPTMTFSFFNVIVCHFYSKMSWLMFVTKID